MNEQRGEIHLPPEKKDKLTEVKRHELWSIFFLATGVLALGLTMGASQAMKTMWLEDLLSLIPTTCVLVGVYMRRWQPDERFNYGYRRVMQIGFLAGAVALFGFGIYLLGDAIYELASGHRATIQTVELFGSRVWLGWLMIAALIYSSTPPYFLGRMKKPMAAELHDKSLDVDASVDKGDWLSGLAGVVGILGLAFGYWWADSLAAGFISFEIIRDGWKALRNSTLHLMDMQPTTVDEAEPDEVIEKVKHEIENLDWVSDSQIRLREVGDMIAGEAFVVPGNGRIDLEQLGDAGERVKALDWRIQDFNIVPVSRLGSGGNGDGARENHLR